MPADYRVGSCYHCLINIPPGSLVAWIFSFIAVIGWATSTWMGLDSGKELLKWIQSGEEDLYYDEIALIAVALSTVLMTVIFLIIATFSSQKMSRYSFSSSKKNTFGYCLSITVVVMCFIAVLFWTGIVGITMIPVAALSVIHILVGNDMNCIHLQSYGVGMITNATTMAAAANGSAGVGSELLCAGDLDKWMAEAWRTLVPMLISLAFAVFIEACLLGFLVAASSNARHLKERMEYMNDSYQYSADNINGNVKPVTQDNKTSPHNNNQSDTQI